MASSKSSSTSGLILLSLIPRTSLWNYNPGNNDTLGDDWNFENFSWFSEQHLDEDTRIGAEGEKLDEGCRLLKAVVVSISISPLLDVRLIVFKRPYAVRTAGIPLETEYELSRGTFRYRFANPTLQKTKDVPQKDIIHSPPLHCHPVITSETTEIFLPSWWADASRMGKLVVACSDGTVRVDEDAQRVLWTHAVRREGFVHEIRIRDMSVPRAESGISWIWVLALVVLLLGLTVMLKGGQGG